MRVDNVGALTASSEQTQLPGHTVNTKGSWVQISASTPIDAHEVMFSVVNGVVGTTTSTLVDFGVGGAGSEQVIVPDWLITWDQWNGKDIANVILPVRIPGGSRLAARFQATDSAVDLRVAAQLINRGFDAYPGRKVVSYGTASGTSRGTDIDPGASANTKGSWVQLVASTNEDLKGIVLCVGNQDLTKTSTCTALLDIGVGGAGSEQVVVSNYHLGVDTNNEQFQPIVSPLIPINIPAGSRIAARAQCSITTATVRKFDLAILGVA